MNEHRGSHHQRNGGEEDVVERGERERNAVQSTEGYNKITLVNSTKSL